MLADNISFLPSHVTVFVNWACNLRCRECWLYGDSAAENLWLKGSIRDALPLPLFKRVVDELLEWQPKTSISFMGGEPFLHKDLHEMAAYLKSRSPDSHVDVSTNGTLVKKFEQPGLEACLDMIYFSFDGSTPEINDPIRGEGSFERAMEGVRHYLAEREKHGRLKVGLNFTITGLNYRDLVGITALAERLNVDELSVNFMMYFSAKEGEHSARGFSEVLGRPFTSWSGFRNEGLAMGVDAQELKRVLDEAERTAKKTRLLIAPTRYSTGERSNYFTPRWKTVLKEKTCPKLSLQTTLLPNGDVISCTPFADTVMGNVNESSLRDIWRGERYRRMRAFIDGGLSSICHRCCDLNNDMDLDPNLFYNAR